MFNNSTQSTEKITSTNKPECKQINIYQSHYETTAFQKEFIKANATPSPNLKQKKRLSILDAKFMASQVHLGTSNEHRKDEITHVTYTLDYYHTTPSSTQYTTTSPLFSTLDPHTLLDIHTDFKKPHSISPSKTPTLICSRSIYESFLSIPQGARYFAGGLFCFPLWFIGSCLPEPKLSLKYPDTELRRHREWRNWNRAMSLLTLLTSVIFITLYLISILLY